VRASAQCVRFSSRAGPPDRPDIDAQDRDSTIFLPGGDTLARHGTRFAIQAGMSQRSVETIIGKLATDEGFRRQFVEDPTNVLAELRDHGLELSPVEIGALTALDRAAITAFAEALDRRLQKVDLRSPVR
jgi:hypothetical protein